MKNNNCTLSLSLLLLSSTTQIYPMENTQNPLEQSQMLAQKVELPEEARGTKQKGLPLMTKATYALSEQVNENSKLLLSEKFRQIQLSEKSGEQELQFILDSTTSARKQTENIGVLIQLLTKNVLEKKERLTIDDQSLKRFSAAVEVDSNANLFVLKLLTETVASRIDQNTKILTDIHSIAAHPKKLPTIDESSCSDTKNFDARRDAFAKHLGQMKNKKEKDKK